MEYLIKQYALEPGALEIQYIEEYFGEFPRRKTAAEIIERLRDRESLILMAEAPLPDDPSGALVPVLDDWIPEEAPPLYLSYRPSERRLARVNHFIQFMQEVCRGWNSPGPGKNAAVGPVPRWAGSKATRVTNLRPPRPALKSRRVKPARP